MLTCTYYTGRLHAFASINSDLWKQLFHNIDSKPIELKLFWVPGHLDKDTSKVTSPVPDNHFLLNHVADTLADKGAKHVEIGMQHASRVLYYSKLVW